MPRVEICSGCWRVFSINVEKGKHKGFKFQDAACTSNDGVEKFCIRTRLITKRVKTL